MTDDKPSQEQILEAAMCAWEEIDQQTTSNAKDKPDIWRRMTALREVVGTTTMRYHTGRIAEAICEAFKIAEHEAGGFYDEPFDWEFVPDFLKAALDICETASCFGLVGSWRKRAAALGANQTVDRNRRYPKSKLTDREWGLLGTVRSLVMGCSFSDSTDARELSAIITDALKECEADELDCEEFRALAPAASAEKLLSPASYQLSRREVATIIAALRERQADLVGESPDLAAIHDIATDCDRFGPVTDAEIDALCERLNTTIKGETHVC